MNDEKIKIEIDDMPNTDMGMVAEYCGVDIAMALMQKMGGMSIYIPKQPYFRLIERIVKEERGRIDLRRMARQFDVTERYLRYLLKRGNNE